MNPLYHYKGIIYLIRHKESGKCYIGQTMYSFCQRYHGLKWWRRNNNPLLVNAHVKYGTEAFEVSILAHSKTLDELNQLEEGYARTYNSYAPHGYNLVGCGKNRKAHPFSVLLRSRTVILNDPDGNDLEITNIRKFCRDNGLDGRSMCRVLSGQHTSHRGWTKQGVTQKHHRNNHRYTFVDRAGNRYDVIGLTAFCQERGLVYHGMRSMTQGKIKESQGFALSKEAFSQQRCRHIMTLMRGEEKLVIRNVKVEGLKYGLYPSRLYKLAAGKLPSYKGWVLESLDRVPVGSP